jgi:hypothetical protein
MKIAITDQFTEENKTPIELENIKVGTNKHGQVIVSFSSKNHKYLSIDYNISTSHFNGEECEFGMGFEIETWDTFTSEDANREMPESRLTLYLIAESKEEKEKLGGLAAILPNKWSYCLCIVPYEDFYQPEI